MLVRGLLLAATALVTGASYGRRVLAEKIDDKADSLIQDTADEARRRIRYEAQSFLIDSSKSVALNIGLKICILMAVLLSHSIGLLPAQSFAPVAFSVLFVLLARDLVRIWPTLRSTLSQLRRFGWKPRHAVQEMVAATIFDRVMTETKGHPIGSGQKFLLRVAGRDQDALAQRIAASVAAIARDTTWSDIRPFLIWASINGIVFAAFYMAFIALVMSGMGA